MLINLADLPEALRKHVASLRACVTLALADFLAEHADKRFKYSLRSEASLINDYILSYAKDRFPWKMRRNLCLLEVERDFRVKCKKMNERWQTSNIQTTLVGLFENQRPLRLFDDMDVTHIYLGYQRDDAEITQSTVWLVYPEGKGFKWIAELTDEAADTIDVSVITPTSPMAPAETKRRITAKKIKQDKEAASASKKDDSSE